MIVSYDHCCHMMFFGNDNWVFEWIHEGWMAESYSYLEKTICVKEDIKLV